MSLNYIFAMLNYFHRLRRWSAKLLIAGFVAMCAVVLMARIQLTAGAAELSGKKDEAASRTAFLEVYKVLMHPRCMNCHPSGNRPLQRDDGHVHTMNVKRGR